MGSPSSPAAPRQIGYDIARALAFFGMVLVNFLMLFDYETGWNWRSLEYTGLWTADGLLRHLFFNGFHPVVPWTAFLLLGMWLGRQDVGSPACRRRLLLGGATVALVAESASRLALARARSAGVDVGEEKCAGVQGWGACLGQAPRLPPACSRDMVRFSWRGALPPRPAASPGAAVRSTWRGSTA